METKANYVLIGAFTLITGLALLAFGLWAAKYSSDRTWQEYRVVFREAVTGLSVGSPVQYNGIAVGSITELNLVPDDPRQVVARIRLNSNTPVKTDTRAKLAITSLTGPSIIQLSGGTPQSPALTTVNKDPAPIIPTTPCSNVTSAVPAACSPLKCPAGTSRPRSISSMRWRSLAWAFPGAGMKA